MNIFQIKHHFWQCNDFNNLNPDACQLYRSHFPAILYKNRFKQISPVVNGDGLIIMEFHKEITVNEQEQKQESEQKPEQKQEQKQEQEQKVEQKSPDIEIWLATFSLDDLANIRYIVQKIVLLAGYCKPKSLEIAGIYANKHYSLFEYPSKCINIRIIPYIRRHLLPIITIYPISFQYKTFDINQAIKDHFEFNPDKLVDIKTIIFNDSGGFVYFIILNSFSIHIQNEMTRKKSMYVIKPGIFRIPSKNYAFICNLVMFKTSKIVTYTYTKAYTDSIKIIHSIIPQIFAQSLTEYESIIGIVGAKKYVMSVDHDSCDKLCNLSTINIRKLIQIIRRFILSEINYDFIRNNDLGSIHNPFGLGVIHKWKNNATKLADTYKNYIKDIKLNEWIVNKIVEKIHHNIQRVKNEIILSIGEDKDRPQNMLISIKPFRCHALKLDDFLSNKQENKWVWIASEYFGLLKRNHGENLGENPGENPGENKKESWREYNKLSPNTILQKNDLMIDIHGKLSIIKKLYIFNKIGITRNVFIKKKKKSNDYVQYGKKVMIVDTRVYCIIYTNKICGNPYCSESLIGRDPIHRCSQCLVTMFCSIKCAKIAWKYTHHQNCYLIAHKLSKLI